mgnify:FL=1
MNILAKKLFRSKMFTALTVLFMAAAIALLSIGICAWCDTRAQLERVGEQYTTIAVPGSPENFKQLIFWEEGSDDPTPLTRQERKYPGLLAEDLRGFLTAHVAGCGTLSCYDVGEYRESDFDVYGAAMAVVAAKCTSVRDSSRLIDSRRSLEDGTIVNETYQNCSYDADFSVEEIVRRHPAYGEMAELKEISLSTQIYTADKSIPFEVGKTYLLFGVFDGPGALQYPDGWEPYLPEHNSLTVDLTGDNGTVPPRTGNMLFYWQEIEANWGTEEAEYYHLLEEDSFPFYAEYTGDWRDFLRTEEGKIWQETLIPLCEINYESAAVILTDNIDSLYQFNTGSASLLEGRRFTAEEYANGDEVCLVGAAYAQKNGLSVGDTIHLDFYQTELKSRHAVQESDEDVLIHGPCMPEARLGVQKDYEIIGIYTAPEFEYGQHSFQGDTIFVPKSSVPNSSRYENPNMSLLYSLILENGRAEEFEDYLASLGFGGMFEYFDQQYSALEDTYAVMTANARRLVALGAAAFALAAALFVFLSLRRMAPAVRGMRLMGVEPGRVWRELTAALALLAAGSAALGGLLGAALYDFVTNRVLASRVALRPEVLALCAAAAAAALLAVSALCALPASRRKLMQSPKKRGR